MNIVITGGAVFSASGWRKRCCSCASLRHADPGGHHPAARPAAGCAPAVSGARSVAARRSGAADRRRLRRAVPPAAIVSSHAESDFDLGMQVNSDATRQLLEAARRRAPGMKFIFTSSLAVFGGELPPVIDDRCAVTPQSSYGAQKAMCELLINDYARKGFVDGRVLRLPTISVRPGKPNKAASSFASGIIREPLHGEQAVCPVNAELALWLSSPAAVVSNFIHAATLPASAFGALRTLNLPGISVRVRRCSKRCARWPVTSSPHGYDSSRTPPSTASSLAGRASSIPNGRGTWASSPMKASSRRSAPLSATTCRKAGMIMAMYTPIIGLAVAVFALIFPVLRTRVHALIAMLIAASIAGITGGMGATQTVDAITKGFGSTLGSIGIVIGLGVMMGRVLEVPAPPSKSPTALSNGWAKGARSGRWPSPAISSVSRFSSIRRSSSFIRWSRRWRKGQAQPADARRRAGRRADPHPPRGAANAGAAGRGGHLRRGYRCHDAGRAGAGHPLRDRHRAVCALAGHALPGLYAAGRGSAAGSRAAHQQYLAEKEGALPSLMLSLLPILTPIGLIFVNAVNNMLAKREGMGWLAESLWGQSFAFLGSPMIALAISVLLAVYTLMPHANKHDTLERLEEGLQTAGIILLVTGAGGALGRCCARAAPARSWRSRSPGCRSRRC